MQRVLITGVTGFIGSHLARALVQAHWDVHGLKRVASDLSRLKGIPLGKLWLHAVDPARGLDEVPELWDVDTVVHLAGNRGQADTPMSRLVEDNVVLSMRALEIAIAHKVPLFVNADTCLDPNIQKRAAYALSKKHFVQWAVLQCRGTQTQFVNMRIHYVYGPGDQLDKFLPTMVRRCLFASSDEVIELTAGEQRKDYIYIDDAVSAFQYLIDRASILPMFAMADCGTGVTVSIRELVEAIHYATGSEAKLRFGAVPYLEGEPMWAAADATLIRAMGWAPRVPLMEGIARTVQYEKALRAHDVQLYSNSATTYV
jgi:nucleoside-diphosphate-sugar epimerase